MFDAKKKKITGGAALIFLLAVFIIYKNGTGYSTVNPKVGPVVEAVYALGTVKADRWYNLRFGMNAVVQRIYVNEGGDVSAGDPLLVTDSGVVFRSPFSGKVTLVAFRENEMAPAGQPVMTVSNMSEMYVRVSLDQESILSVRKGQEAVISFENLRGAKTTGMVKNVYPSGAEFIVRVSVEKFPDGVLPEMTCDAAIAVRKKDRAVMIPLGAVENGRVALFRAGKRMDVPVAVNPVDDEWTEVMNGAVKPDDKIILKKKNHSIKNNIKKQ